MTRRLDPGAGWYGEFLRRDPGGVRDCLEGVAIPPWDVLESLLGDLPGDPESRAREAVHAAGLRAAAVAAWDAMPGGERELRLQLDAAAGQWAASEAALRSLTDRLGGTGDPGEAAALARELAWTRDDAARAAARHTDLTTRLRALPLAGVPRQRDPQPDPDRDPAWHRDPGREWRSGLRPDAGSDPAGHEPPEPPLRPVPDRQPDRVRRRRPESASEGEPWPGPPSGPERDPEPWSEPPLGPGREWRRGSERDPGQELRSDPGPGPEPEAEVVGRAEGRWLRGVRRAGGARYAGAPSAAAVPAAAPAAPLPAPRGARFAGGAVAEPTPPVPPGRPAPAARAAQAPAGSGRPAPERGPFEPAVRAPARRDFVAELLALREQSRTGEAHALLCEAAAWPAERLPALAAELARAGLSADWATLLWEAASLPPDRLAAAAAALGGAGREGDCDRLLRQGVARPAAEVAEAALALGAAGRDREARTLLGAFVRLRTPEEAAALARRDPHWFAPRLLAEARAQSGTRHRDLAHALRVAGIPAS
ncbi:hypothetical protein ACFV6G_12890 [Streptomyces lavendulae]|uniref:hypothetical protein n=1 Tax=Streptomyces lavendulae TaxID=1914 RepID=UPI0036938D3B